MRHLELFMSEYFSHEVPNRLVDMSEIARPRGQQPFVKRTAGAPKPGSKLAARHFEFYHCRTQEVLLSWRD